jgi:DNA primase
MAPTQSDTQIKIRRKAFKLPPDCSKLHTRHKKYLKNRGFDPDDIEVQWQLQATGPLSKLDNADYRHRIIAPIIWEGQVVSFQARDITGKSDVKYKACPKDREEIHHQHILYCHQEVDWSLPIIVVEGITDVWRLGQQAVGVFGIDFLPQQVRSICQKKKEANDNRVIIIFDDDPQAIKQGEKLMAELNFRGMECQQKIIEGDPGDMGQKEANELIRHIIDD